MELEASWVGKEGEVWVKPTATAGRQAALSWALATQDLLLRISGGAGATGFRPPAEPW